MDPQVKKKISEIWNNRQDDVFYKKGINNFPPLFMDTNGNP